MDQDARLMVSFQQGNVRDFELLMQRRYRSVLNLAYRFLGDATAAEDVAQDVFLQLFRSAATYRPKASFTTWLYTITRNACYSELRRRGRKPLLFDEQAAGDPPAPDTPDSLEQAELQRAVKSAIASLPQGQRMAVILRRYEQLSYEQIAEVMGATESAVKSLLHRSRETLKEKLKGFAGR